MQSVGAYEAKTHLPRLLARVAKGEQITITKHGIPIAMLVPAKPARRADPAEVIEAFRKLRQGIKPLGVPIRDLIEEGRRY